MSIQNVPSISIQSSFAPCFDAEEQEIARRLLTYGETPTGDKTTDKARLRQIELKKAQEENSITNKFLTVSKAEQEKIQEKKKIKRKENNPDLKPEEFKGAKILGQQVLLAKEMKQKKFQPMLQDDQHQ